MRHMISALAVWVLATGMACASGVKIAGPVIRLEPESVDLGSVTQGTLRSLDVLVHNDGTAVLKIISIDSDCGCTVPQLPDSTLGPGEQTTLHVELSTSGATGRLVKHVYLRSNDPGLERAAFTLMAQVRPPVAVRPNMVDFGAVERGAGSTETVAIKAARTDNLRIDDLKIPTALLTARTDSRLEGDSLACLITLTLRPDAPCGPIRETIEVRTNLAAASVLPLHVRGQVLCAFKLDPLAFAFGQLRAGDTRERRVRLSGVGPIPRHVREATCTDSRLRVAVATLEDGRLYEIAVTIPPGVPAGSIRAEVHVTTDDPEQAEIVIPVMANVRRAAP